jgi:ribonuclease HI
MPSRSFPRRPSLFPQKEESGTWPERYLVAHIDGGSRGNPGPAGFGVVLHDESGHPVAELSDYLGRQTNNHAEYAGLLAALEYAVKHGSKALKAISDSELMVKQMNGQYKVSNQALRELYDRAKNLVRQLDHFQIRHVLREKNQQADRLANLAMDRGMGRKASAAGELGSATIASPEVNGRVHNGVVEFLGTPLPDGTLVKVRVAPPTRR